MIKLETVLHTASLRGTGREVAQELVDAPEQLGGLR